VIAGRYELVEVIGRGGMGAVWRARNLALESEVAVKQIEPRCLETPQAVARFLREAKTVASRTPHVVQVFDRGLEGEIPFIVSMLGIRARWARSTPPTSRQGSGARSPRSRTAPASWRRTRAGSTGRPVTTTW
jgi:hypothetical protein